MGRGEPAHAAQCPAATDAAAGDRYPVPEPADLRPGPSSPQLIVGGSTTGRKVLHKWLSEPIDHYAERGDRLDFDATSHLAPYLHFGCLSTVQILATVDPASEGGRAFVRQLTWRDFHHQVLAARPDATWSDYRGRPNRKLDPLRQADRFDPDGTYVRRWLPELADLAGNGIHRPWRESIDPARYPALIVECAGM